MPPSDALSRASAAVRANDLRLAEDLVRQYLVSSPSSAEGLRLLVDILRTSGRRPEMVEALRRAIVVFPADSELRSTFGVALAEIGRVPEALPQLEEAARLRPSHAPSRHNLGVALAQVGRQADAVERLREAIALQPDYPEAWYNLGNVLKELGRSDESMEALRRAVELRPLYGEALNNLGWALTERGKAAEAVSILRQSVRLRPTAAEGHNNLGLALADLGQFEEAEACYCESLRLDPGYTDAHVNLGNALKERGRTDEALSCYQMALWLKPDLASARYNRSFALLQAGRWKEAWPEYEWRWRRGSSPARHTEKPRWDGAVLSGRTILLWCEQGLGDAIQFVRYAALVKEKGGRVVLECPAQLTALLANCSGVDAVVAEGEPLPPFDVQASLLSLPGLFGTTPDTVPGTVPYLAPEPARATLWQPRMNAISGFRVGIMWQGNRFYRGDRTRSFPLRELAPLAAVPGVRLVGLQKGPGADQIRSAPFAVTEFGDELDPLPGGFRDSAAVMKCLDLVVSCDSAASHLAGALGVKTWLALSTTADWRWLLEREETPWYPAHRIFRQDRFGDWKGVFERMAAELSEQVRRRMDGTVMVAVSPGELLDRASILAIKAERFKDAEKRGRARAELADLVADRTRALACGGPEVERCAAELAKVNERLWEVEDELRRCERDGEFGDRFVVLARSVYRSNDARADLKRRLNRLLGSALQESKEYITYERSRPSPG
jgi:tetratricopeptide (TPR) repeat protein